VLAFCDLTTLGLPASVRMAMRTTQEWDSGKSDNLDLGASVGIGAVYEEGYGPDSDDISGPYGSSERQVWIPRDMGRIWGAKAG